MKTKFKLIILLILTLNLGHSFAQEEITKQDAFDWMQGKMSSFEYSIYFPGNLTSKGHTTKYAYEMQYDESTCNIKIIETYGYVKSNNNTRSDFDTKTTFEFNMSDIKSIEDMEGTMYKTRMFLIKTYNDKNKVIIDGNNNRRQNYVKIKYTNLGDIEGEPERFLKAFKTAMDLCGSKKEKF